MRAVGKAHLYDARGEKVSDTTMAGTAMHIVTDGGADLTPVQLRGIDLHIVNQRIELDGKVYRTGVDIQSSAFYDLLARTRSFPTTSEPSVDDYLETYRALAGDGREIVSLHISSGLSQAFANACEAAAQIKNARITLVDSKTVSGALGWQVAAAAHAAKAGWSREELMPLLKLIGDQTDIVYTLATLKYLIHGGRINHLRGLIGSMLDIKPIITLDKIQGINAHLGSARTLPKAVSAMVEVVLQKYARGHEMRFQIFHGDNAPMAEALADQLSTTFKCTFLSTGVISPLLGAHTGPGLVGLVYAPNDTFARLPWE
jgi:DegV family protein with EDD domain